jgi:hypothetical protein
MTRAIPVWQKSQLRKSERPVQAADGLRGSGSATGALAADPGEPKATTRRLVSPGGCHRNGRDLHVCDAQLVIDGRFTVG